VKLFKDVLRTPFFGRNNVLASDKICNQFRFECTHFHFHSRFKLIKFDLISFLSFSFSKQSFKECFTIRFLRTLLYNLNRSRVDFGLKSTLSLLVICSTDVLKQMKDLALVKSLHWIAFCLLITSDLIEFLLIFLYLLILFAIVLVVIYIFKVYFRLLVLR